MKEKSKNKDPNKNPNKQRTDKGTPTMQSPNMNYRYNVEYFKYIKKSSKGEYSLANFELPKEDGEKEKEYEKRKRKTWNNNIIGFKFQPDSPDFSEVNGINDFSLKTIYPGLLIGIGNEHDVKAKEAYKAGFTFDYVTGMPYIPGSSLKGMLRSYFPDKINENAKDVVKKDCNNEKKEFIKACLNNKEMDDNILYELKDNIFENNDVFIGAYPSFDKPRKLIAEEYITPHKEKFKDPKPISLIKVKPGIQFKFYFVLTEFNKDGVVITAEEKMDLFKNIILYCGAGAKTNVGFGEFEE